MKYSLEVPVNSGVTNMIHDSEMNIRAVTVDNFRDPIFGRFN
jgi:hypothetical protein